MRLMGFKSIKVYFPKIGDQFRDIKGGGGVLKDKDFRIPKKFDGLYFLETLKVVSIFWKILPKKFGDFHFCGNFKLTPNFLEILQGRG